MSANFPVSSNINPRLYASGVSSNQAESGITEAEAIEAVSDQLVGLQKPSDQSTYPDSPYNIQAKQYPNGMFSNTYVSQDGKTTQFTEFYKDADGPARLLSGGKPNDGIIHLDEGMRNRGVFEKTRGYLMDVGDGVVWPEDQAKPKPTPPQQAKVNKLS